MVKKVKHLWANSADDTIPTQSLARKKLPIPVLIGAPDDRGVRNVGGRIGASGGPSAVRKMLSEFSFGIDNAVLDSKIEKGEDIDLGESIETAHLSLKNLVLKKLKSGHFPIVLGGGHDFGFPHLWAASECYGAGNIALINVDAHLDVRPLNNGQITSGSPFFLALERKIISPKCFVEFGIQDHCNDPRSKAYLEKKKAKIFYLEEVRKKGTLKVFTRLVSGFKKAKKKIVVSFDVDAVSLAWAPGVSAPQVDGFSASEFFEMLRLCGKESNVVSVGFFETSPLLDENQKTVRLVATAIHRFLTEFSRTRKK